MRKTLYFLIIAFWVVIILSSMSYATTKNIILRKFDTLSEPIYDYFSAIVSVNKVAEIDGPSLGPLGVVKMIFEVRDGSGAPIIGLMEKRSYSTGTPLTFRLFPRGYDRSHSLALYRSGYRPKWHAFLIRGERGESKSITESLCQIRPFTSTSGELISSRVPDIRVFEDTLDRPSAGAKVIITQQRGNRIYGIETTTDSNGYVPKNISLPDSGLDESGMIHSERGGSFVHVIFIYKSGCELGINGLSRSDLESWARPMRFIRPPVSPIGR